MKDRPNRDALNRAVDIFRDAMRPFIVRNMRKVPGMDLEEAMRASLREKWADDFVQSLRRGKSIEESIDVNDFPHIVQRHWREVFDSAFGGWRTAQNSLWQIVDARNHAAHPGQHDLGLEYVRTYLYHIADTLGRINAPDEKRAVEEIRDALIAPVEAPMAVASEPRGAEAQLPQKQARADDAPQPAPMQRPRSRSSANLKAWREVVPPSDDVAHGTFRQAEFMADLQQVYDGRADASEYGNPVKFFDQTHITPGIRALLVNTLQRLAGKGGDPVIQAKTGFGGGKTHSLIALYHLVKEAEALLNPPEDASGRVESEIRSIMDEAGWEDEDAPQAEVAVIVGTYRAPTDATKTENGDPLNTLWGMMAHQLGGQQAYEIVGLAAREGTAPGGAQLDALFEHVGPCVILIDELVAYVRNAGAATDAIYTFIQALTESVRRARHAVLVVTLPDSRVEAGGAAGEEALDRLERLMGRVEAVWQPLETHEAFEVVRRRLFGSEFDTLERDRTCEEFSKMYGSSRSHFPKEVREQRYLDLMKQCYPVHPEIFERLNSDWSSLQAFQRTRGVLRMMAACISRLYQMRDAAPMILPGNLTLSDPALADEFLKLLGEQWRPVLEEIDREGSRTDNLDGSSPNRFGTVGGAAKRIARTVFLGSAPSRAFKGINPSSINLGVVEPGHGTSVYGEALEQMRGRLYYLYEDENRRYFHAEENLNKVAIDRSAAFVDVDIDARIISEIGDTVRRRSDVIVCPESSDEVLDTDSVRLIVLSPAHTRPSRSSEKDEAEARAQHILSDRGGAPRIRKNTLLFLAAKSDDVRTLRNSVRTYLAWDSIVNGERRIENLTGERLVQAKSNLNKAEREMKAALAKAYRWAMAPVQDDPQLAQYRMAEWMTNAAATGEVTAEAFRKCVEEEALVDEISPPSLANVLKRYVWKEGRDSVDHVGIDALWDMMTANVYMPRLRNKDVLLRCVERGVARSAFGYADAYDDGKYTALRFGHLRDGDLRMQERGGLLVNPEMAQLQLEDEAEQQPGTGTTTEHDEGDAPGGTPDEEGPSTPGGRPRRPSRIVASKTARGDLSLDEIDQLRDEIIRVLQSDGGEVEVNIVISGSKRGGFSENIARSIRENGVQLGLAIEQGDM